MKLETNVAKAVVCPSCRLLWDWHSEQHAGIELFGECICCRFMPDGRGTRRGSQDDITAIQAKHQRWEASE